MAVLVAAWNAQATIARAVTSALQQAEAAEVCVVDDGSTDQTAERARACDDGTGRLKVIRFDRNQGPSAARNAALDATASPWVAILDADDYFLAGRLQRLLGLAADDDLVADALVRIEAGDVPAEISSTERRQSLDLETFARGNLGLARGPLDLGFLKPLIRREALRRAGLRYDPAMRLGEDYDLYARVLAGGGTGVLTTAAGYVSVRTSRSLSQAHSIEDLRRLRDCDQDLARASTRTSGERRALRSRRRGVERRLQWRLLIEAVKARQPLRAVKTFESVHVSLYLAGQLIEQAWLRSLRALRGVAQRPSGSGALT